MKTKRRIKGITGMNQLMLDIKPDRCDSDVFVKHEIDVTNLMNYLAKRKEEGRPVTFFHAFLTAAAKTLYNRPKLNYFIQNRHVFEHTTVSLSFVAKVDFQDNSEEMMLIIPVEPEETLDDVANKIKNKIEELRVSKDNKRDGAQGAIDILAKLPNIIRVPIVGVLKWLDKKGKLPASIQKDNLYYSSMILSNLGSIHFDAIYHNITNFGECSSLVTIGEVTEKEILIDGHKEIKKVCDIGANFDERVADGYYFVKSVKLLENIMTHPELLDEPVSKKVEEAELR